MATVMLPVLAPAGVISIVVPFWLQLFIGRSKLLAAELINAELQGRAEIDTGCMPPLLIVLLVK